MLLMIPSVDESPISFASVYEAKWRYSLLYEAGPDIRLWTSLIIVDFPEVGGPMRVTAEDFIRQDTTCLATLPWSGSG